MLPTDKDAREKYEETMKEHKLKEFAKVIGYDDTRATVDVESILVEESYSGPRLDEKEGADSMTHDWVLKFMDYMKDQKVLHKKYAT